MIAELKPYSAYRGSGVPWLGDIPSAWTIARNGGLFSQRNDTGHPTLPILEVSLKTGVRVRNFDDTGRKQVMSDRGKYKRAAAGDLAYNMMRMWQGAAGIAPVDGLVSPAYVVARPFPGVNGDYFARLFRTDAYMSEVDKYSHGIVKDRNRLYWEEFKQMPSPRPPSGDQAAIVRFLEYVDRRIRRYIHAKQKLIKLLEEQKQVLVHHAVTRGLDPNVRLKPSGVDWLGDVPEHWEVKRMKHLVIPDAGIQMGPFGASLTQLQRHDTGFRLYGQENTISGDFQRGSRWITESQFSELRRYELRPGDLVLTRKGSIGKCRMLPDGAPEGIADSDTIRVRVREEVVSARLITALLHHAPYVQLQIHSTQRGAVLGGLNTSTIAGLWLAVPPKNEQDGLLDAIERVTETSGTAAAYAHREIALLGEYRTRLIADVVTGKLDVREAAARLPDEREETGGAGEGGTMAEGDEETEGSDLEAEEAVAEAEP